MSTDTLLLDFSESNTKRRLVTSFCISCNNNNNNYYYYYYYYYYYNYNYC